MSDKLVAVLDIGKTHSRLELFDPAGSAAVWSSRYSNRVIHTHPWRELDIDGIERWLLQSLSSTPHRERIDIIIPIAHGAAAVLIDEHGAVLAAPDYEDSCYEQANQTYETARDPYRCTCSPTMPLGLNLGRQWAFLQQFHPSLFDRAAHLLLYPQFWAWRLSGVLASEVTSLGCHTDLWRPAEKAFSTLARKSGWTPLLPAVRSANDVLGTVSSEIVRATGLDPRCRVVCGIHDSNASYLRFLKGKNRYEPFTVVSSGTWTVVMASQTDLSRLREDRTMLANVNVAGEPVATARFMGGREYAAIAGCEDVPEAAALDSVLQRSVMAHPPRDGNEPVIRDVGSVSRAERVALATLYCALMTDLLIEQLGASGEVFVDGPLAKNRFFAPLLAALGENRRVTLADASAPNPGLWLAGVLEPETAAEEPTAVPELELPVATIAALDSYRDRWRAFALA
ncbi:MAG: FGGY family carbohydrate kinase [Steroidobacteraceae bacterium]